MATADDGQTDVLHGTGTVVIKYRQIELPLNIPASCAASRTTRCYRRNRMSLQTAAPTL